MEYQIPFTDQKVSTDDPEGSLQNVAEATLGFGTLFGITALAGYLYNRAKAGAGVDGETNLPIV